MEIQFCHYILNSWLSKMPPTLLREACGLFFYLLSIQGKSILKPCFGIYGNRIIKYDPTTTYIDMSVTHSKFSIHLRRKSTQTNKLYNSPVFIPFHSVFPAFVPHYNQWEILNP